MADAIAMLGYRFDPLVAEWFEGKFGVPTEPQREGWKAIGSGEDVLISAPTGSGKTLAAFLICLDRLVKVARTGDLADRTVAVYVSPLKALSSDIARNLEAPLAEIRELAGKRGVSLQPIRTALRTGDTPASDRRKLISRPPHILVTTPESLFILLTAARSREVLKTAGTVIVDEIHAVAGNKRGSHLSLSLARLERLSETECGTRIQKIGLSATVRPMEDVAGFLIGKSRERICRLLRFGHQREMDLSVAVPQESLGPVATNEQWEETYDAIARLAKQHRTTLIFVNTRRLSERVAHRLAERLGSEAVLPHHGSLSRELRLEAEDRLKRGDLRAVVATASLELGIDIGTVDLVCQIGSPRSISVALQRIGRSGHWVGALPRGRLFPMSRDGLIECAALVHAIRDGELDRLRIPKAPLDVLAQQIVAAVACEKFEESDLFRLVRRAHPYRSVPRQDYDAVLEMLSEGVATARGRRGAYLHRDRVHGLLRPRRGARLAAITSGGAIPDTAQYLVLAEPAGTTIGMVDEDFAVESSIGDVFLLGTTSWRVRRVESGQIRVEDARGAAPSIPFWLGEAPGRTAELSSYVSSLRMRIDEMAGNGPGQAEEFLARNCGLDPSGAGQAVRYVAAGKAALGAVPTAHRIVAERFFDEAGGMQLVIHAPLGSQINRAWGLALRKRFCRSFNLELQAAATDDGIVISLTEQHSFPLDLVFGFVQPASLRRVLTQALLDSPMFSARWRWNASRALAVLRFAGGRKVPAPLQRMRADDLLAAVFPDQAACAENLSGEIRIPDHPLVRETIGNCLHEAMDLDGLATLLESIRSGAIETVAADTPEPSPFSHEVLNSNPYAFLDNAPLEERRARAVQMRRVLDPGRPALDGALDAQAIETVEREAWPLVRDAEELHDALLTLVALPQRAEWIEHFGVLAGQDRATSLEIEGRSFWVCAERLALARQIYPGAEARPAIGAVDPVRPLPEGIESSIAEMLGGWFDSVGPRTAGSLCELLRLPEAAAGSALAQLEGEGRILRGRFSNARGNGDLEWCDRRLLARIHRRTLGRLRREIEPASSADIMRFLLRWQHAVLGRRLHGTDGTLQVIRKLQGYEISAAAWEAGVLPLRVADYKPEHLDRLCLSGEVIWCRMSPHPAFARDGGDASFSPDRRTRPVRPTRSAPITFLLREDAEWLLPLARDGASLNAQALSHPARETLECLRERGACFFSDLARHTRRLPSEIEEALWELTAAGVVTADGFDNLRSLIDPKRRSGARSARNRRPRHSPGRWTLQEEALAGAVRISDERLAEALARQLLARWGIVFRDLIKQELFLARWRGILGALRRMEARGEIRGGRFADAFRGEQFALPEALELLRAVRRKKTGRHAIEVSAADPLNLTGIVLPGPRRSAASGETLRFRGGGLAEERSVLRLIPGATGIPAS
ncbi:MAG: DEAD/DEAH box helicase [Bryobacterales bacterium]|nr:DEAD/DEAH box helicase [Bryobacterales bacterium]